GNLTFNVTNDLSFLSEFTKTGGGATFAAGHDINLNAVLINVAGALEMYAGLGGPGAINSTIGAGTTQISSGGGPVQLAAPGGALAPNGGGGGSVELVRTSATAATGNAIEVTGTIDTSGGKGFDTAGGGGGNGAQVSVNNGNYSGP